MIKRIKVQEYAYLKILEEQNIILEEKNNIIMEGFWQKLKDGTKSFLTNIKDAAINFGKSVGEWFKNFGTLIKISFSFLTDISTGTYKKDPKKFIKDTDKLSELDIKVFPFMKKPIEITKDVATDVNKHEFNELKSGIKGKDIKNIKKLDTVSQLDSNMNTITENTTFNIDDKLKSIVKVFYNKIKDKLLNCFKSEKIQAEKAGEELAKKDGIDITDKDAVDPVILENINLPNELIIEDNCELQIYFNKLSKDIHDFFIDNVYKGITPKMIMETIDNEQFSNSPQPNLIIENKLLSFKTNNGNLICEEYNLQTKDTIIYESETEFKGKHLIFEETENQYKKFNHIITESEQQQLDLLMEDISYTWIFLTILGFIPLILWIIRGIINGAKALLTTFTGVFGVAFGESTDKATVPVQADIASTSSKYIVSPEEDVIKIINTTLKNGTSTEQRVKVTNKLAASAIKAANKAGSIAGKTAGKISNGLKTGKALATHNSVKIGVPVAAGTIAAGNTIASITSKEEDEALQAVQQFKDADKDIIKNKLKSLYQESPKNEHDKKVLIAKIKYLRSYL